MLILTSLNNHLPHIRKRSASGFEELNCPVCHLNGEPSPDRKGRGAIMINGDGFVYTCLRCRFKASYKAGRRLSKKAIFLLEAINVPEKELSAIKLECLRLSNEVSVNQKFKDKVLSSSPVFQNTSSLPDDSKPIVEYIKEYKDNIPNDLLGVLKYIKSRGLSSDINKIYWSPSIINNMNQRMIIPFYHRENIVGYSARYCSHNTGSKPKYFMKCPHNYMYNVNTLYDYSRKYVILTEGVLDAFAIDGVGYLGNSISDQQVNWLNNSGKEIILVPDFDNSGMRQDGVLHTAIENNWHVSFPDWRSETKDIASSCEKYGKIFTLYSILNNKTNNQVKIKTLAGLNINGL